MENSKKYQELLKIIEETNTKKEAIDHLLNYYVASLDFTYEEAIDYTIKLFKDGVIDEIKVIGGTKKNGK